MMYRLRGLIRGSTRNVEAELLRFEEDLGKDLKPVMGDALRSKAPEDGQNLLTYAAAQGSDAWFLNIAREIRSRVSLAISGGSRLFAPGTACRWVRPNVRTLNERSSKNLGVHNICLNSRAHNLLARGSR